MTYILLIWLQPATDGRLMARLITRRRVIKAGLIAVHTAVAAGGGGMGWLWASADVNTVGHLPFRQPLTIPTLADSQVDAHGRCVFELTAQPETVLLPGTRPKPGGSTESGGPTRRASRGETVLINVHNGLGAAPTVHRHGMHLPARFDGGPHTDDSTRRDLVALLDDRSAGRHPVVPPASARRDSGTRQPRGLAGMFILNDVEDRATRAIPHEYGVDDIPVIVQDRSFGSSGDMIVANLGDTVLVNGTYSPFLEVTTQAVWLRILNASYARVYNLGFNDNREFSVIATDGGLLPAPLRVRRLTVSPAERAEIVVRVQPDTRSCCAPTSPNSE